MTLGDRSGGHFTNWSGIAANYATVRFTVPRHEALLDASIAWPAAASRRQPGGAGQVHPRRSRSPARRRLAAAGNGGYGAAQVLRPAAGTWTAVIFSDAAAAGGTAGEVSVRRIGCGDAAVRHRVAVLARAPAWRVTGDPRHGHGARRCG